MIYKIIGYFEESGKAFECDIEAPDPHAAMFEAAKQHHDGDLVIVGAVHWDDLYPPCEDSGKTASAETLYQNGAVVKWTLAGEEQECSLREWMDQNYTTDGLPNFDVWEATEKMELGERVMLGGGAQPLVECWMPCWLHQPTRRHGNGL